MSRVAERWIVLLACLVAPGCSLMGLGDYELFECEPGEACVARNQDRADECVQYYCTVVGRGCEPKPRDDDGDGHPNAHVCSALGDAGVALDCDDATAEVHPGQDEDCDGLDNNCNGYVDEGTLPDDDEALELNEANVEQLSYAAALDGTLHLMLTRGRFATTHLEILSNDESRASALFASGTKCTAPLGAEPQVCNIDQLAIAATADVLVGAGIHRSSCDGGQLRVGVSAPERALELGDGSPGPTALGVDVERTQSCSLSTVCPGAREPAVAVLDPDQSAQNLEALVVWLAPFADNAAGCRDSAQSQLLGLGLAIEATRAGAISRLRPTSEGAGEPLGEHHASGPPAVVAFASADDGAGYVVAYPSAERVALLFVPQLSDRASLIPGVIEGEVAVEAPGNVAIAAGDASDSLRGLAVAFRTDHGGERAIRLVPLALVRGNAPRIAADGTAITLAVNGDLISGPALAYASEGFAPAGQLRAGGWSVLWIESVTDGSAGAARLMAARIAERDRLVVDQVDVVRDDITDVFTYSKHDPGRPPSRRYGYVTRDAIHLGRLSCQID